MFRGAAILQGVYKRALMGNASDERAKLVGSMAAACASIGVRVTNGIAASANKSAAVPLSIFQPTARLLDYKYRVVAFMERFVYVTVSFMFFDLTCHQVPRRGGV